MKKILSITALCLIAMLAVTIIVFAFVNKNYNPNLTNPDYIQICINKGKNENVESYDRDDAIAERQEVYNKVMDLYNKSFYQNVMSGLFQGTIFSGTSISKVTTNLDNTLSSGTFVAFNYNEEQTLKLNGKVYTHSDGSTNIKYKTLYVEVQDTDAMTDITIYVKSTTSTNNYSYYRYTVKANQGELYSYLQENFAE